MSSPPSPQAPGAPERLGFAHRGPQAPSPAQEQADSSKKPHVPGAPDGFDFAHHGPQVPSPTRSGANNNCGAQAPSPAIGHLSGSVLARNVLAAVAAGSQIQCNAKQYPAIRAALTSVAENKTDSQDETLPLLAIQERERLDLLFMASGCVGGK